MYKVFYEPNTLQIKGFSDGETSMDFPYVETDVAPILLSNYKIEIIDEIPKLSVIKESFTGKEWDEEMKK